MLAAYENAPDIRERVMQIVETYHPAGRAGSEDKGERYEAQMVKEAAERKDVIK